MQIRGVSGDPTPASLAVLRSWGGNCVRIFSPLKLGAMLDMANAAGIKLMAGLSWGRLKDQNAEAQRIAAIVDAYKTHPGLLCWNIGNEQEGPIRGSVPDSTAFLKSLHAMARMIKARDPAHLVGYTFIDFGSAPLPPMIQAFRADPTSLDYIGINTYIGAPGLAGRYAAWRLPVPFCVTELGWNPGHQGKRSATWSVKGQHVYYEKTSTEKAEHFRLALDTMKTSPQCLGVLAFRWGIGGSLPTDTWHMIATESLLRTDVADELINAWMGGYPAVRAPNITSPISFEYGLDKRLKETTWKGIQSTVPNDTYPIGSTRRFAIAIAASTPGAVMQYRWQLRTHTIVKTSHTTVRGSLVTETVTATPVLSITLPTTPGMYRLYVYAEDPVAATAAYACRPLALISST